ncbi:hypothetical protein P3T35_007552 [Kitasatospora sp. GP30]|uniref:hypothetical protein n=1 Tax=Kitasatospora sp. GP30 TaxID=3035084 RepID=UPI000C70ABB5|nr:hypothetical protein [Kitasatospora sp. GP30]MDH6145497.1 hypothetical protein [Kitasatospora sp. GP30]
MLTAAPTQLPDVAIGHHPNHGIVASLPTQSAPAQWFLERLDFQQLPGNPGLFTLTDQHREPHQRAAWAAKLLTGAGYRVDTDMALAPNENTGTREQARSRLPATEPAPGTGPDVAFAEHPQLGVVAATDDTVNAVERGGQILEAHGWRFNHVLDVYTLPVTVDRGESLERMAAATTAMHRAGDLQVAVQPRLAEDLAARRAPAQQAFTTHKFRANETSLKATTAVSTAVVVSPPPTAVDPRIAFARAR